MDNIEKNNLNIEFCRSQRYDGAANISSQTLGVQKRVKDLLKKMFPPIVTVTI